MELSAHRRYRILKSSDADRLDDAPPFPDSSSLLIDHRSQGNENTMKWNHWIIVVLLFLTGSLAFAQNDQLQQAKVDRTTVLKEIPPAALLTDRGEELANRLYQLRRNLETMGIRHPSRGEVELEIKAVIEQLSAWSPSVRTRSGDPSLPDALPAMNEHDLRQVVLRLYGKVQQLESRLEALESKVKE